VANPLSQTDPLGLVVGPVLPQGDPLRNYADTLQVWANRRGPYYASEYTSPSGQTYYGYNNEGVPRAAGGVLDNAINTAGAHGNCAEMNAMARAEAAEGDVAVSNGSMRTVRVRGLASQGNAHGTVADPCVDSCQPALNSLNVMW
jgi:hypothetical protein